MTLLGAQMMAAIACEYHERGLDHGLNELARHDPNILGAWQVQGLSGIYNHLRTAGARMSDEVLTTPLPDGRFLLSDAKVWSNFDRLYGLMRETGLPLKASHLTRQVRAPRPHEEPNGQAIRPMPAIARAAELGHLDKVFRPELWRGREGEMLRAWAAVPDAHAGQVDIRAVRRDIARLDGRPMREDLLERAGVSLDELRRALATGDLAAPERKMKAIGEALTKDDFFAFDDKGRGVFEGREVWQGFGRWANWLAGRGEPLTLADLRRSAGDAPLLEKAHEAEALATLLAPAHWAHAPEIFEEIESDLPPESRARFDAPLLRQEAEARARGWQLTLDGSLTRESLLRPIADPGAGSSQGPSQGSSTGQRIPPPLAMPSTWANMDRIERLLARRGEPLRLADLRRSAGPGQPSFLSIGVRLGHIDKVLGLLDRTGETLTARELTARDPKGRTLLDAAHANGQLPRLFAPEHWVGRASELASLHDKLPRGAAENIGFKKLLTRVNRASLHRELAAPGRPRRPGANPAP